MTRIEIITGTDTDVGKTWATAALAAEALVDGARVHVDKPVQTGVEVPPGHGVRTARDGAGPAATGAGTAEDGDVHTVRRLLRPLGDQALSRLRTSEGVRLGPAMAPLDAVADEPSPALLTLDAQLERWRGFAAEADALLIEGAGGITVAWTAAGQTPVDAARAVADAGLGARGEGGRGAAGGGRGAEEDAAVGLVVVTRPGLGTQNHTLLTLEHAARHGAALSRLVVSGVAAEPDAVERANLRFLRRLAEEHGVPLCAVPLGGTPRIERLA